MTKTLMKVLMMTGADLKSPIYIDRKVEISIMDDTMLPFATAASGLGS